MNMMTQSQSQQNRKMSQIKQTIIFLLILGLVFLGIAYAVSVNMEIGFWSIDSNYSSNNFLFTCFSGVFASIIVLLATEIYRFRQNQKDFEQLLFSQLVGIYGQLQIAHNNITKFLDKSDLIPDNLLNQLAYTINHTTPSLRSLDYNKFISTNKTRTIKGIVSRLVSTEISQMDELSQECLYLPMAIATDKMDILNRGIPNPAITAESPNTQKVLKVLLKEISRLESRISFDITELNTVCDNRFHWNDLESAISNIPDTESSLEAFFSKHK